MFEKGVAAEAIASFSAFAAAAAVAVAVAVVAGFVVEETVCSSCLC